MCRVPWHWRHGSQVLHAFPAPSSATTLNLHYRYGNSWQNAAKSDVNPIPDSTASQTDTQGVDPNQLVNVYVAPPKTDDSYIWGQKAGPYVAEKSLNIYTRLGARMALVGIDARVEVSRNVARQSTSS